MKPQHNYYVIDAAGRVIWSENGTTEQFPSDVLHRARSVNPFVSSPALKIPDFKDNELKARCLDQAIALGAYTKGKTTIEIAQEFYDWMRGDHA